MQVREVLLASIARLDAAGIPSPRVDAELLLAHSLGVPRARLVLVEDVDAGAAADFEVRLARREQREPLQHILGTAPFRSIEVAVGPGVFVPRPETELLVDAVLATLWAAPAPVAVDLCAGTGALALALVDEVPGARVYAVERSSDALAWLHRNTAGTDVRVVAADVADPGLLPTLCATVHAVVSNPPYVPTSTPVAAEVAADPAEAVFAGADGLAVMPSVIARAAELLRPGGILALEHDESHAAPVADLLGRDGRWREIVGRCDLTGRPRYSVARRS